MKSLFFYCLLLLFACNLQAQNTPVWQWAKTATGPGNDFLNGLSTDNAGHIYTLVYHPDTISVGDSIFAGRGSYLAKYNVAGNLLWQVPIAPGYLCNDPEGNIIIAGEFSDTLVIGHDTLIGPSLPGSLNSAIFIAKYDSNGQVLWTKSYGGNGQDMPGYVTTDAGGNILVSGLLNSSTIHFGSFTLHNQAGPGGFNAYLLKLAPNGNESWAMKPDAYNVNGTAITSITSDEAGNVYAGGIFANNTAIFDNYTFNNYDIASALEYNDIFILKYDSGGNLQWAQRDGGPGNDEISYLAYIKGHLYAAGTHVNNASFDTILLTKDTSDVFLAQYDTGGNIAWAKGIAFIPGTSDNVTGLATDTFSDTYLVHWAGGAYWLNPANEVYIEKYDTAGNLVWSKNLPNGAARGISVNEAGDIFVGGEYDTNQIDFDSIELTSSYNTGISSGAVNGDIFIARLSNPGVTAVSDLKGSDFNIKVFPNPFSDKFTVQIPGDANTGTVWGIGVCDLSGRLLTSIPCTGMINTIDYHRFQPVFT